MSIASAWASVAAPEETFDSVQATFRQRVVALAADEVGTMEGLKEELVAAAAETLGAHPELVTAEFRARLARLPELPAVVRVDAHEQLAWTEFPEPPAGEAGVLAAVAWDPVRLAALAKQLILAQQLAVEAFGRRAMLSAYCPDETYRLGEGDAAEVAVVSLGELFVVRVALTEGGVPVPATVRWLRRR